MRGRGWWWPGTVLLLGVGVLHASDPAGRTSADTANHADTAQRADPAHGAGPIPTVAWGDLVAVPNLEVADDVRIDGALDEPVWAELPARDQFVVLEPDTLQPGVHPTLIRMFYTSRGLYIGADLRQPPETRINRLSGRDNRELNRDSVNVTLDTSGAGLYGYWFGVNLGGSLSDGTVLPERQYSNDWDGPWRGASAETATGWTAELFIPWSTVAMPASGDVRRLGIYISRKVAYLDERWGWPAVPFTQARFMSALQQMEVHEVAPRQQYNIYPFAAVTFDEYDEEVRYKTGVDLFWRPSTNFQLNATVNPDFGTVESDELVINLTATETFFPEKRLFFLEGQDIFTTTPRAEVRQMGVGRTGDPYTMLYTRRIGGEPLPPDLPPGVTVGKRELERPVELEGAAKVTGEIGEFRYGVLGAFEKDVKFHGEDPGGAPVRVDQSGSDYGVARLLWQSREDGRYRALGFLSTAAVNPERDAYVQGVDGHYLGADGKFVVDGQMFTSDIDDVGRGYGGFVDFEYTFRQGLSQRVGIEYFDEQVDINDLGFLTRNDNFRIRAAHTRTSSNLRWARSNQFDLRGFAQRNNADLFTGANITAANRTLLRNLTEVVTRVGFSPGYYDDLNSFGNGAYRIEEKWSAGVDFNSDTTRPFAWGAGVGYNDEDLGGHYVQYSLTGAWRPSDRFNATLAVVHLDRSGWLLHQGGANMTTFAADHWQPNLAFEYFVSAKQQFRLSLQWVGIKAREQAFFTIPREPGDLDPGPKPPGPSDDFAISDMIMQARWRWEIAPLSDLFVVYTRAADIGTALHDESFDDLLHFAWNEPIANHLVIKLRYRFGS